MALAAIMVGDLKLHFRMTILETKQRVVVLHEVVFKMAGGLGNSRAGTFQGPPYASWSGISGERGRSEGQAGCPPKGSSPRKDISPSVL